MSRSYQDPLLQKIADAARADVDPDFDFASPGPIPWRSTATAVTQTRVALITTASLHLEGDRPFRTLEELQGDTSYRIIPQDAPTHALDLAAPYVDRRYIPTDPEVALPRRALANLHRQGKAGPPAPRHASFSAGIIHPLPGLADSAASLSAIFREDAVGAVILFPTCPMCVQTTCVLARELESRGFVTVAITLVPELTRIVGAPRSIALRFPFGAPCGDPGHGALHRAVLLEALDLIASASEPGTLRESRLSWRRPPPTAPPAR